MRAFTLLSLAEKQYAQSDPFLKKLKSMNKRVRGFFEKAIVSSKYNLRLVTVH
jgi:hypothetical protein